MILLKKVLLGLAGIVGIGVLAQSATTPQGSVPNIAPIQNVVPIKYGDPIDVSEYESIDTSRSSFIEDANYDADNEHLILDLNGTNYEYCDVPEDVWEEFQDADSLGSYFNAEIKGNYDC